MNIAQIHNKTQVERLRCRGMDIPVRFVLVSVPEDNIIEEGSARICNINSSEIEVSDIETPSRSLPLKPFQVTLFIEQEGLGKIHMLCSVRWINSNGSISLGLYINQIPERHRFRLNEFVKEFENKNKKILQRDST
jgi:hypothetical protein